MTNPTREKWDKIYSEGGEQHVPAVRVVEENLHLAPNSGRGLELACGRAANSFAFAERGLEMDAWDISPVVIELVNDNARKRGLAVHGEARDVVANPPESGLYDLVVASHFLERDMTSIIIDALKPGGLLFYQTFTQTKVSDTGPSKPEWRLADGELLTMFAPLIPLVYREEGLQGDITQGLRSEALLVAKKPE